jgi:hypothetical protein
MNRGMVRGALAASTLTVVALTAGCGGGGGSSGDDSLRAKVEARFKQAGVSLYEVTGVFGPGGDDMELAPKSRLTFGDFAVHIVRNAHGFQIAEATAGPPDTNGVRWDDTLATHNPPYYTSFKRYGKALELQWSTERRSTDEAHWRQLDAIMHELQ